MSLAVRAQEKIIVVQYVQPFDVRSTDVEHIQQDDVRAESTCQLGVRYVAKQRGGGGDGLGDERTSLRRADARQQLPPRHLREVGGVGVQNSSYHDDAPFLSTAVLPVT